MRPALFCAAVTACAAVLSTAAAAGNTIADIVSASGGVPDADASDFDLLQRLLSQAAVLDTLADADRAYTVFAPTDAAFVATAEDFGFEGSGEREALDYIVSVLAAVGDTNLDAAALLRYHVVPEALPLAEVLKRTSLKTLLAGAVISRTGAEPLVLVDKAERVRDAALDGGRLQIEADNGFIHVVDRVLWPISVDPEVVKRAVAGAPSAPTAPKKGAPAAGVGGKSVLGVASRGAGELDSVRDDYDIFVKLADAAGLSARLADEGESLTLFLPSDAAFVSTAQDLGFNGDEEQGAYDALVAGLTALGDGDAAPLITRIVQYHVSPSKLSGAAVQATTAIETLAGEDITRSDTAPLVLSDKAVDVPDPTLVDVDIAASNGVIHTISRVLLPVVVSKESLAAATAANGSTSPTSAGNRTGDADASPGAARDDGGSACFPSSAVVHLADGSELPMAQLLAGHEVKAAADEHSPVFLFTHRQLDGLHEFVRIESESGHALSLSANHYVYANGKLAAADAVRVGDVLSTLDGASRVRRVGTVMERGLVAPHTLHGDIVVNGVRASSYTRSVHPRVAHVLLAPVRAVVRAGLATEPLGGLFYDGADRLAALMPKGI
jgi:uncharacterized surface protein with fasciclin (FAS1) repeats